MTSRFLAVLLLLAPLSYGQDVLSSFVGIHEGDTSVPWDTDIPEGWQLEKGGPIPQLATSESLLIQRHDSSLPLALNASVDTSNISGDQYRIEIPFCLEKVSGDMTMTFASYPNFTSKNNAWSWCVLAEDNKWFVFDGKDSLPVPAKGIEAINLTQGRNYTITITVDRANQTYSVKLSDGFSEFQTGTELRFRHEGDATMPHLRLTFASKRPDASDTFAIALGTITLKNPNLPTVPL